MEKHTQPGRITDGAAPHSQKYPSRPTPARHNANPFHRSQKQWVQILHIHASKAMTQKDLCERCPQKMPCSTQKAAHYSQIV
ncbi:MAG TPA: hypothetical protein PLV25_05610 [Opitutales bacterium]|nr:hypothetical protein [Opitutales bacterium]